MDRYDLLRETSRSFFRVITSCGDPVYRDCLCTLYLLLRALDTLEDDPLYPVPVRVVHTREFVERFVYSAEVFDTSIEKCVRLMQNSSWLSREVSGMPASRREIVLDTTRAMSLFMSESLEVSPVQLGTIDELHGYCFGVSGCLVRPLVSIRLDVSPALSLPSDSFLASFEKLACSLQMVNIIRDVKEDSEVQGRCYWPRSIVPVLGSASCIGVQHLNLMISLAVETFAMSIPVMLHIAGGVGLKETLALPFPWEVMESLSITIVSHLARMYDNPLVMQGRFVLDKADWARCESGAFAESVAYYLDLIAGAGSGSALRALEILRTP